jgi:ribokinase
MLTRYQVLCVGSATVDHFLTIKDSFKEIHVGDKVLVQGKATHTGGGATNAASALAKFGIKTKMLTKLGDDGEADFIIKEMKKYGVPNVCNTTSKHRTDTGTLISSEKNRDRIIYVHKGASRDLRLTDCSKKDLKIKWIYLASLVGKSFNTAKKLAEYTKDKKIDLLFNPSLYVAKKGKKYLKSVLSATTILVLNKEEAQALLNNDSNSLPTLIKALHKLGPKKIVITNGNKKFYASDGQKIYSMIGPRVKRVHTAGAGDAFTAAFLGALIKKYSFADALRIGQVNASSVIQHIGTKHKQLTESEAKTHLRKYKIKVNQHVL